MSVIVTQDYKLGTTMIVPFMYDHKFCVMRDHREILDVKVVFTKLESNVITVQNILDLLQMCGQRCFILPSVVLYYWSTFL